jgi:uncharacterized repeat protein (TIGR03803 family)
MTACMIALFLVAAAIAAPAQTFTSLFSFDGSNGSGPNSPLVQGFNGNVYQTANLGGQSTNCGYKTGCGTVFEITPDGKLTTIYNFCSQANCTDGAGPDALLSLGNNGNFYGTTNYGGANNSQFYCNAAGCGTVFEITPGGKLTTLYNFCAQSGCSDGVNPAGVIQAANGNLYGTAFSGGANNGCGIGGCGTFFELTPTGKLTTLYSFCAQTNCADGSSPVSGVVQATNGNFYGTTAGGGAYKEGTVFEITPAGKLTTLHSFCAQSNNGSCVDGSEPIGPLMQAKDGNFYGTTYAGGNNFNGTVFAITPTGVLTTVYSFCSMSNCDDGAQPASQLVQGTDGNFYGATVAGGHTPDCLYGCGTAFELTPGGKLTTLYNFCDASGCPDGLYPVALTQSTNGTFYGTTDKGGRTNCRCGTIFSLATGLGPFAQAVPNVGKVGRGVTILGNDLTGTSSVSFNGTAATFKVVSETYLEAQVPIGATTGTIQVVTPSRTLSSNVAFQVLP